MTKPTDGAMRAVHMLDHDPYGTPDQRAAILDREAVAPAVRELVKAAAAVLKDGRVAAPGPHFRWDDEYYQAFTKLEHACDRYSHLIEESGE